MIEKENPIQKAVWNVKTNFVDFVDENTDADDNDYNFAFVKNRDWFGHNQS